MEIRNLKTNLGNEINGPKLIKPNIYKDSRGFFYESWNQKKYNEVLEDKVTFYQDNISRSKKDVIRGLHYQLSPKKQGKLVRCTIGTIFDIAVDVRKDSSTFGEWVCIQLSSELHEQFWIPEGFAHGFLVLTNYAEVHYKASNFWEPKLERSIIWNDKDLSINWPLKTQKIENPILNKKDADAYTLKELIDKGEVL